MRLLMLLAVMASVGLAGCEKRIIPEQDVVAFVKVYVAAGNKADLNELRVLYSQDLKSMSVDSGYLKESRVMLKEWEPNLDIMRSQEVTIGLVQVMNLGTSHALALVPFTMRCPPSVLSKDTSVEGVLTLVVSATPEGLRAVHDAYNFKKQCG